MADCTSRLRAIEELLVEAAGRPSIHSFKGYSLDLIAEGSSHCQRGKGQGTSHQSIRFGESLTLSMQCQEDRHGCLIVLKECGAQGNLASAFIRIYSSIELTELLPTPTHVPH